jgi:uncharacterized membrane protein
MRTFSFRPALQFRGREFHGLRGFEGKPFHPPLTDIPIGAYVLAAVFDVVSRIGYERAWAHDFYRAASFVLIGGAAVSVLAALTGFLDWFQTTEKGTQARRTVNAHAWTMVAVTVLVLADIALRVTQFWGDAFSPTPIVIMTVLAALLTFLGGAIGGSLVFDYGFNVATAGDSPVWHRSELDVMPGEKEPPKAQPEQNRIRRVS